MAIFSNDLGFFIGPKQISGHFKILIKDLVSIKPNIIEDSKPTK